MDIKQEELDKRYVDGVLAVESLVGKMAVLSHAEFTEFCRRVQHLLQNEIGPERLAVLQGKEDVRA